MQTGATCILSDEAAHHIAHVLRMRVGQQLILFNGQGRQFTAEIIHLGPRILRTETAALVAITACQVLWGDIF